MGTRPAFRLDSRRYHDRSLSRYGRAHPRSKSVPLRPQLEVFQRLSDSEAIVIWKIQKSLTRKDTLDRFVESGYFHGFDGVSPRLGFGGARKNCDVTRWGQLVQAP